MYIKKGKRITWIDLEAPSRDDLAYLKRTFKLNDRLLASLGTPTTRPHVEEYAGAMYLVVHVPVYNQEKYRVEPVEFDFVITKKAVITVHYQTLTPVEEFKVRLESAPKEYAHCFTGNSVYLVAQLFDHLFEFFLREIDHIRKELNVIQDKIFTGDERKMVKKISFASANIINFRRTVKPQRSFLLHLSQLGTDIFGAGSRTYFNDILDNHTRVLDQLESHFDTIQSLRSTNESLLSAKINRVVGSLTIITGLILPFQFILELNEKGRGQSVIFWAVMAVFLLVEFIVLIRLHRNKFF